MKKKLLIVLALLFTIVIASMYVFKVIFFSDETPKSQNNYKNLTDISEESCLQCHANTTGFSVYHNPKSIGCISCHLGNGKSFNKVEAHTNMVVIPGNLIDAEKTCGKCHASELSKIKNSIMTTNSGIIAVDKYIFGEAVSPNNQYHINALKNSPSDKHIRDLCANCHLGSKKETLGPITELSGGGGCNACHLNYSIEAQNALRVYLNSSKTKLPKIHPSTSVLINDTHCFGCHSRSSRISTNYQGWSETLLESKVAILNKKYRIIDETRVYRYIKEDVHHAKGMLCIDCHSSQEVMGDGNKYLHEEDAVKIQCSDCHFKNQPKTIAYDSLDAESINVFLHRNYKHFKNPIIAVKNGGHPLVNTYIDAFGNAFLIGKRDGALHKIPPQSSICARDSVHRAVSCSSCHSSWTSRCIGCHTQFDKNETQAFDLLDKKFVKGQWKEYAGEFDASLPAMGVKYVGSNKQIMPAIPGMILSIDHGSFKRNNDSTISFHRLYAPNSPHTTVKKARDCKSCHSNPLALGYGNGNLRYEIKKGLGNWKFNAEYVPNKYDKIPEDAWISFLEHLNSTKIYSTRTDFRPFTLEEQKKLLLVGSCLECHQETSKIMQQSLIGGLKPLLKKVSPKCILPTWH